MDVFIEKIVAKKKKLEDNLIVGGLILAGFAAIIAVFSVPVLAGLGPLLAGAIIFGVFYLSKSRNIEFEYAVTNGELDIDKIIAQRKRKRIFSANCKDFEIVAKVQSEHYNESIKQTAGKIDAASSIDSPGTYFALLNYKGVRTVVYFEPDQRMLNAFKTFNPRKVYE
ncbi:MAG: hypothetical protein N2489_02410 [Clostridia bacterium]|nr:hypothetical protein [Clostridia bacterium]